MDDETYDMLFEEELVIYDPERAIPYVYFTNLYDGMKVAKGWVAFEVLGTEYCDEITFNMYSTTAFNDGLSERKRFEGNTGIIEFDCTDVGDYTLMVESRNNATGELFEYDVNFTVVDTTTPGDIFKYFLLGMWDGVVETAKGVCSIVAHPIQSAKSLASGVAFFTKAIVFNGAEREALYELWITWGTEVMADFEDDEVKDTARKAGKFTAEIVLIVATEKGVTKAIETVKEAAKTGKLSNVSKAWIKTGQKADDFVDDLVATVVVNKFDHFAVIANKFPDEALPSDGFVLATTVKDGKIAGLNGLREVDFVIKTNGEIVVGFRHTVLANGDVLAAGRLKLDGHGKIRRVTNESGHYRPTVSESMQFEKVLQELGIDLSKTWVNYYEFTINANNLIIGQELIVNQPVIK